MQTKEVKSILPICSGLALLLLTSKKVYNTWVKVFRTIPEFKMLNKGDYNLVGIMQVLRLDFQKFRILKILNFHP